MLRLPPQFESVLDSDEQVLWSDRPAFVPFLLNGVPFLILGLGWGALDYFGFIRHMGGFTSGNGGPGAIFFYLFFAFHLFPFWGGIGNMLRLALVHGNTFYAFTNKRIVLRSGFWGTDFKAIDYDRIQELEVTVNPIENLLGVGTIRAFSGRYGNKGAPVYDRFTGIQDPYGVFKRIKEVSVDVKTDWNFPNAQRPPQNPGYRTRYEERQP